MNALVVGLLLWAAPALAKPPAYVNLKSAFQDFVKHAQGADLETQLKFWQSDVEAKLPDIYEELWRDSPDKTPDQFRRARAEKWFPFLIEHADAISRQFDVFDREAWPMVLRLASKYPTVDFSDVRVVAVPSLITFNGKVESVKGKPVAMFGMDFLELVTENPKLIEGSDFTNDTALLVTHEFTHALHAKLSPFGGKDDTSAGFFQAPWKEGLAQVNSQMMVHGADLTYTLFERNLAARCTSSQVKVWARKFLEDSRAPTKKELDEKYGDWFVTSRWKALGVPRAGYCLGYHLVLAALRDHSLNELLRMKRAPAYALVKKILAEMAAN